MAECEALVLNVPDDILGIDDGEFKQNKQVAATSRTASVYITDANDGGRFHRIYF